SRSRSWPTPLFSHAQGLPHPAVEPRDVDTKGVDDRLGEPKELAVAADRYLRQELTSVSSSGKVQGPHIAVDAHDAACQLEQIVHVPRLRNQLWILIRQI